MTAGKLVVFEGVDGTGKSTQINLAVEWLAGRGIAVEKHREPGGTAVGERVRSLLLDPACAEMVPQTEMMLFYASRAQLAHEKVRPALSAGKTVLLDRYYFSTAAYQGPFVLGGFERVLAFADQLGLPRPDLVVCLDIEPEIAARRRPGKADRIEAKGLEYQRTVRKAYQTMAGMWPAWFRMIDAGRPVEKVHEEVASHLEALYNPKAEERTA